MSQTIQRTRTRSTHKLVPTFLAARAGFSKPLLEESRGLPQQVGNDNHRDAQEPKGEAPALRPQPVSRKTQYEARKEQEAEDHIGGPSQGRGRIYSFSSAITPRKSQTDNSLRKDA